MKPFKSITITKNENTVAIHGSSDTEFGNLSFYFTKDEWDNFCNGEQSIFADGIISNLHTIGDFCTFYRMEIPFHKISGVCDAKFANVTFPIRARKIIQRYLKNHMVISISDDTFERWGRMYGQGSGKAELEFRSPETKEFFEQCISNEGFVKNIEHLRNIARNSTFSYLQTTKLYLSKDLDGFNFSLPRLHGGIVNHNPEGEPDWSIHT